MSSDVPRGEVVRAVPLVTGLLGAIPFAAPYVQWATGGLCREVLGAPFAVAVRALMDGLLVAGIGTIPFVFVLWPARSLRGGRSIGTAFAPLVAAFCAHFLLLFAAVQNPMATFLIDHTSMRSPIAVLVVGLVTVAVIACVGVAPVWTSLSVRAETTAPRFEALLASCGLWLVVASTLARFFRSAQLLPLGAATPVVLACGLAVTVFALTRGRSTAAPTLGDGPYRRDGKASSASALRSHRGTAAVLAVELALVAAWAPTLAERVVRPCLPQ
jgi:hypothetical protein